MDLEQQLEEIEALSAIYPEEFKVLENDELKKIVSEAGWTEEITNVGVLHLKPQEDNEENIHGNFIFSYFFL